MLTEKLTFRDVRSPQEFRHGEAAEVVCDVIASPAPAVSWFYQKGFKSMEITEEHYSKSAYGHLILAASVDVLENLICLLK